MDVFYLGTDLRPHKNPESYTHSLWGPGSQAAHKPTGCPHNAPHHLREASCSCQTVLRQVPRPPITW